jgi:predicted DNA-binding transcriptional regulator AlpA
MKTLFEQEDIQGIASEVIERLKPFLNGKGETRAEDIILDVPGLTEYLHVTSKWIHERTHLKEIPFIKLSNKQLRFKKKDIDKWLDSLKTPAVNLYTGKIKVVG